MRPVRLLTLLATTSLVVIFGFLFIVGPGSSPAALAHQADCSTLDAVVTYNAGSDECELKTTITKNGTFAVGHTLHIFPAGKIITNAAAGLTLNITGGLIIDTPTGATGTNGINGDAVNALARPIMITTTLDVLLHGNGTKGARITSSRTGNGNVGGGGNITILAGARSDGVCLEPLMASLRLENGSQVQVNSQAGAAGAIVLNACKEGTIAGLVESASQQSGAGNTRGGGPIDVITQCSLTVTDTGKISSRSNDPRGDRVHLEGCDVLINGLVESIAKAHYQPEGANGCKGTTRPDKPNGVSTPTYPYANVYSSNCVEVWGRTITVDASGAHNGQISADSGGGGNAGTGWIDLYASGAINIIGCSTAVANDCTGAIQGIGADYFALHANGQGGSGGAGEQGGLVTVKSTAGTVSASGLAFEAYAGNQGSNSDGGIIAVEASGNVDLKDSFSDDGAADQRGGIAVRSYTGKVQSVAAAFLDTCGVTVGKETGSQDNTCTPAVPASPRWVTLQGCGTAAPNDGVAYLGTTDQNPPNKPADSCVAGPIPPAYVSVKTDCTRCLPAVISGVKFEDLTANGVKDAGDPLLSGWTVKAYLDSNHNGTLEAFELAPAATTTTAVSTGAYSFTLPANYYIICETAAAATWHQSLPTTNTTCPPTAVNGYAITTNGGQTYADKDFGNWRPVNACAIKFEDLNNDGTYQTTEPLKSGWNMRLVGAAPSSPVFTGQTNAYGKFCHDLDPSTSNGYACEGIVAGWTQTLPAAPGSDGTVCDGVAGYSAVGTSFPLTSGQTLSIYFGNTQNTPVSGLKYEDNFKNGVKDGNDSVIKDWVIKAYKDTDNDGNLSASEYSAGAFATTTTAVDGSYTFNLPPGKYIICEDLPAAGWFQSQPGTPVCSPTSATPFGYAVTAPSGSPLTGKDFGNYRKVSLCAFKYNDLNGNGESDGGEPRVSGWNMKVLPEGLEVLTDTEGKACFDPIDPGTHYVCEAVRAGWLQTAPNPPSDGTGCDNVPGFSPDGFTGMFPSGNSVGVSFGNQQLASFTGTKFMDRDADGLSANDPPIPNWTVYAFKDGDGNGLLSSAEFALGPAATATTDAVGKYTLQVLAGDYIICEASAAGWTQSYPATPPLRCAGQSSLSPIGYWADNAVAGQTYPNIDFANYQQGTICAAKYNDLNGNGAKNDNEPSIPNWEIKWFQTNVQTGAFGGGVTNANGLACFDVVPGQYHLCEVKTTGWAETQPSGNTLCNTYTPIASVESAGYFVSVQSGQTAATVSFGNLQQPSSICGTKFHDLDGDGVKDAGEPGLPGWTITLSDNGTIVATTTTGDGGAYCFNGVPDGAYAVCEQPQSLYFQSFPTGNDDDGYCDTGPVDYFDEGYFVQISGGTQLTGKDFGNYVNASICGNKFEDLNANGVWDQDKSGADPALAGWTIYLSGTDGTGATVTDSKTTVVDKGYCFSVRPGTYTICEEFRTDWQQSVPNPGNAGTTCAFAGHASRGYTYTMTSDRSITDADFGNWHNGTVGGVKFEDDNANGVQDPTEDAPPNFFTIFAFVDANNNDILDQSEFSGGFAASDQTDANGVFEFGLPPGEYIICEQMIAFWTQTAPVNNICAAPISSLGDGGFAVTVTSSSTSLKFEFGNHQTLTQICGKKWEDLDSDGVQDPAESGVAGWPISVLTGSISVIATGNTDAQGNYCISVAPGSYRVCEGSVNGWQQTYPTALTGDSLCISFLNLRGYGPVAVAAGQTVTGIDFGNHHNITQICGTKFEDLDGSGSRDAGEPGLVGWEISVLSQDEQTIFGAVNTDPNGNYCIPVASGTYKVCEPSVAGWQQTYPQAGVNTQPCANFTLGYSPVAIAPLQTVTGLDFGNQERTNATICGAKFEDLNGDGDWDKPDEPSLGGWGIVLIEPGGRSGGRVVEESETVEGKGYPCFEVPAGTYELCEVMQDGWTQSFPNPGTAGTDCPDFDSTYGPYGYEITVADGDSLTDYDFGNYQNASICGKKFHDLNGNGLDDDSAVLSDWEIGLSGTTGAGAGYGASVTTDANGEYCFSVAPGSYVLCESLPSDYRQSYPAPSGGALCDAIGEGEGGYELTVTSGQSAGSIDFGNYRPASICGTKWDDLNANGVWDGIIIFIFPIGEPGIDDWTIHLTGTDGMGNGVDLTETTAPFIIFPGYYCFDNLAPGTYTVCEVQQAGWYQSGPASGPNTTSCAPGEGDVGYSLTLNSDDQQYADFLNYQYGQVCGTKWHDENANGSIDGGEHILSGVGMHLVGQNGNTFTDSTSTDTTGSYCLSGPPGSYVVCEDASMEYVQSFPTGDQDGNGCDDASYAPEGYSVVLTSGASFSDYDFGNYKYASVCGLKFEDLNANGVFTSGDEPGLSGWTIDLIRVDASDNVLDSSSVLTLGDGSYCFNNLPPGRYYACEQISDPDFNQSFPNPGTAGTFCSGRGDEPGGYFYTLTSGQNVDDSIFGNYQDGKICGAKFNDVNGNGAREGSEPGIQGWQINFVGPDTTSAPTGAQGEYCADLKPGTYTVCEVNQSGWNQTYPTAGNATCNTAGDGYSVSIVSGQTENDVDFGNHLDDGGGGGGGGGCFAAGTIQPGGARIEKVSC